MGGSQWLDSAQMGGAELIDLRYAEQSHRGDNLALEYFESSHQAGPTARGESPTLQLADRNGIGGTSSWLA